LEVRASLKVRPALCVTTSRKASRRTGKPESAATNSPPRRSMAKVSAPSRMVMPVSSPARLRSAGTTASPR
jgi:hypothetical protein